MNERPTPCRRKDGEYSGRSSLFLFLDSECRKRSFAYSSAWESLRVLNLRSGFKGCLGQRFNWLPEMIPSGRAFATKECRQGERGKKDVENWNRYRLDCWVQWTLISPSSLYLSIIYQNKSCARPV